MGANKKAAITADEKQGGHVNYFVGNDKTKWRTKIPTYKAVTYNDVYKNIDIKFYGNNKNIEHDVIVRPGGDPSVVRFAYEGVKGLKVTEDGDLEVSLTHGKLTQTRPVIYQVIKGERVAVDGSYRLIKGEEGAFTYGFTVASYDQTKDLVIDPVLVYSTYLGGTGDDTGYAIAVDSEGAAYVTGQTGSVNFPLVNPIQGDLSPIFATDAFITKINPAGSAIVYSTYLGGLGNEVGNGIAVDSSGAAYITGWTSALDFPLVNPIQGAKAGDDDAFIAKINPAGSALVYSTYLGGSRLDLANAIAVDETGAVYVTGKTSSVDFPLLNPIQGPFHDAFVTKINAAGSAIVYSTYLGSTSGTDEGRGIAVDLSGAAYVTGWTWSTDFPVVNPIQGAPGGAGLKDAFVTKINPAGSAYAYSTYLGGIGDDIGNDIAVDPSGAVYVTGATSSIDFPLKKPIQRFFTGDFDYAFVTKINPAGSAYVYSTYLGGLGPDTGTGIAVDSFGAAYVSGHTGSDDFPLVAPIQVIRRGGPSVFITKINTAGSAYVYSTYLGSTDSAPGGVGIAVNSFGEAYVTGKTSSTTFPLKNPIQGVFGGGEHDAFIAKIGVPSPVAVNITPDPVLVIQGGILGYTVTANNTTATQQCFQYWENVILPNGVLFPTSGELFGPVNVCLNAGASKTVHLTHGVPLTAPVGDYFFNTFIGTHPAPLLSETHFYFHVNPAF